ncbi:MAG: hypothetical protein ONB05_06585, partial [candidate division KSB1 bacterium]|nr:hypothetical protein [candidate division KSB1 bacterium]
MFVKPQISKEQAEEILSSQRGLFSFQFRKATLLRVELVFLPCYLFTILLNQNREEREIQVTIDGIQGSFALFQDRGIQFTDRPEAEFFKFQLSSQEAREKALEVCRGQLIRWGFRKRHPSQIKGVVEQKKVGYPYWVGYFKRKEAYDFKLIDAVSGSLQGIPMRRLLLVAFRQAKK